ncbi:hypothetical protein K6W16_21650 [Burkholderia dolosa]|jgi:hypothetical protein|uniref:Uncharacterized protein n=1 Tax=Burkholderia dolosa TaxID=152500 RepID=A0A892IGW1_9BURK|nr:MULTISPECIES: hypothetical protein [Burkholderia]AJY09410.1 hypothetical protein AK34_4032 [Burkholderia dolosa AU0158]MBR8057999.1 hypothetical protein [Burkholderia dolosa]MBR8299601.1 hypothetical protein [Burkholderia dolosa]MBR8311898.1 hypothetical protein [Burkholderia dolosa]MBR8420661.1 hypothetical protein [Burkholderia dolosa]
MKRISIWIGGIVVWLCAVGVLLYLTCPSGTTSSGLHLSRFTLYGSPQ